MSAAPRRREALETIFRRALAAVDAAGALRRVLVGEGRHRVLAGRPLPAEAGLVVLAAGKAAAPMAAAFEAWAGERLRAGLAVTKDGHGVPLERVVLREASHPVPDERGARAAREALALVEGMRPDDVLCVLLSGGASSLLSCPAPGLSPEDLARTTRALLEAGADIEELNAVRKHLSAFSGGRLAARAAARRIELLAVSDVPGDRLDVIGSGPCTPDPSRFADALGVLDAHGLRARVPSAVRAHLEAGARGEREETPKGPFAAVHATVLARNRDAVEAARDEASRQGLRARVVSAPLAGEAREAALRLVALGERARGAEPVCLVAGGETTVSVRGAGRGGRSQELALAAALEIAGGPPAALLAAGTDGSDGPTPAAGAYADEGSVERGRRAGRDARADLARNDSHGFFAAEGGLLVTGPTGTNVMDLALLRVDPSGSV